MEGFVQVPGGRVWYRLAGRDAPGIPLLALHGGPGAPHDYLEPIEALARDRPVIFYDQLGCGHSDKPEDSTLWTVERFVEELARVRAHLGLERVHLLGQSWGCMLAVDYVLRRSPAGVASLVLSGPCLSVPRFVSDQRRYVAEMPEPVRRTILECEARGDFGSEAYRDAVMAYYRRHVCRLDPWPDCLRRTFDALAEPVYRHLWGPSEFTVSGTLGSYDRTEDLRHLACPALFTCGRYDEATPETTEAYRRKLPGSELAVIEDASHAHHLERTETYLRVVGDFLRRAEARAEPPPPAR